MIKRILLVANENDALEAIPITLALAGHDVFLAPSGLEAIKQARVVLPDLIIVDTILPDMDGATVVDLLHRLPSTAAIRTMLLKPRAHRLMPALLRKEGFSTGLTQPLNPSHLLVEVGHALNLVQSLDLEEMEEGVA